MIDWNDENEIKKFKEKHFRQMRTILSKRIAARENGDKEAMMKTTRALAKHMEKGRSYEKKAEEAGFTFY